MMTQRLLARVRDILEECDQLGFPIDRSLSSDEDSFILRNTQNDKSILIGEVEAESGKREIIAFEIAIHKWKWAEDEGFSKDQIIDEFANEIFSTISIDTVSHYLTDT